MISSLMRGLRRRLASCALALLVLQCAMPFAAPIAACCAPRVATPARAAAAPGDGECCPAGSHPPGECPRHQARKSAGAQTSQRSECRMTCGGPHGPQLLLPNAGLLPAPAATDITLASVPVEARDAANPLPRRALPDAPPPKRL
jgi:hypothetical protein